MPELISCANPDCDVRFEPKRGKKYHDTKCKSAHHNNQGKMTLERRVDVMLCLVGAAKKLGYSKEDYLDDVEKSWDTV